MNQTPPGWYQDPQGAGQRYWDGTAWTEHLAPAQAAPVQAAAPTPQPPYPGSPVITSRGGRGNTGKIVGAIVGAIAIVVGVVALIGAASGTKIDTNKAENLVQTHINGAQSVKCPSGIEAKSGKTFDCKVTLTDGSTETVTLHIKDDSGNAEFSQSDVSRP